MPGMLRSGVSGEALRRVVAAAVALALAGGVATVPEAWTTTYYVATTGSNGNTPVQAQNPATPWKTLTHALAQTLASGDVIQVQPGTYDSIVNGETFPLSLVDGVTVKGDPSNPSSTTVTAPAGNAVFFNQNSLSNLTTLTGLTITHDTAGATADLSFSVSSSVTMAPQITANRFVGFARDTGILIQDEGGNTTRGFTGLIDHNTFTNFSDGVAVQADSSGASGTFSPTISNNTFTNPSTAIALHVSSSFGGTVAPLIQGNTVSGATAEAIFGQMSLTSSGSGASFHPTVQNNNLGAAAAASEVAFFRLTSFRSNDGTVIFSPTVSGNTVSGANVGIAVEMGTTSGTSDSAGTVTSNVTISGNTLSGQSILGIAAALSPLGSSPSIGTFNANWTIANNTVTGPGIVGIGISTGASSNGLNLSGAKGTLQLTVSGNTVKNAGLDGIATTFPGLQAVNVSRSVHIQGNESQASTRDGVSLGYGLPNVKTDDVQLRDNFLHGNAGVGLEVSLAGSTEAQQVAPPPPLVRCNTITGNTMDGIRHDSSASFPVDYGSIATSQGLNTLSGNTSGAKFDFDNQLSTTLVAQNNWWGSPTGPVPAQINGNVTFSPFLTAPPSVASIPLTVTVVNDVAPPGASIGDTLRYTATITLSNTCGCAQAVFSAPIPANVTEQAGSATTTQGTVTSENPITVSLGNLTATAGPITVQWDVVVSSGTTVSSQGTLTCNGAPTLSNDPSTPAPSDPTVTTLAVQAIAQVPALSQAGMAILIGGLLLAGLCLLRRRRRSTGALVLLLLLAGGPWAAQATTPATAPATTPKPPRSHPPLVGVLATPAGVSGQSGGQLSLLLADGTRIAATGVRIEVSDKRHGVRGKARIKTVAAVDPALAAGAGAMVKVFARPDGSFESIRILVLDSVQAAQDRVAKYHHKPKP